MAKQTKLSKKQFRNQAFQVALGAHCRKLRIKKGFSVNRLAQNAERLSPSVILRLEHGTGAVTIACLERYAGALGVPIKTLFDFPFALHTNDED